MFPIIRRSIPDCLLVGTPTRAGQFIHRSARYQALTTRRKTAFDKTLDALCAADLTAIRPGISPARKKALVALYTFGVNVLAADDWLTTTQAAELAAFASAL